MKEDDQTAALRVGLVADDADFLAQIEAQPNFPEPIKQGLRHLY